MSVFSSKVLLILLNVQYRKRKTGSDFSGALTAEDSCEDYEKVLK